VKGLKPGESINIKETKTKKEKLLYINQASYEAIQNDSSKTTYMGFKIPLISICLLWENCEAGGV
jgi:hypothetical protein